MTSRRKLLIVVLDAAEPIRVERLMNAGLMPNLSAVVSSGNYKRVQSTADWWVASPWPSFYTGTPPSEHGFYYYLWWDPVTLRSSRPGRDRFRVEPFWRNRFPEDARSIVIDGSEMHAPLAGDDIELSGWRTHDILSEPWIYPRDLAKQLRRRGWQPAPLVEAYRPMDEPTVRKTLADLAEATRSTRDLACLLLKQEPWDFALVSFTSTHMAGHQFWASTSLAPGAGIAAEELAETALDRVYMDCDDALGRILETCHAAENVIVCSLHGMEQNRNRGVILPEMLNAILGGQRSTLHGDSGIAGRLRNLVPEKWRHAVKSRAPMGIQDFLTGYWRTGGYNWKETRAVSFVPDLQAYIRVNQRGREAHGIVEPGPETEAIKRAIRNGLCEFVDADDGEPIVSDVRLIEEFDPAPGVRRYLPDVVGNWAESPAARHTRIAGPNGCEIDWPQPGKNSDGRSGNHSDRGFLATNGRILGRHGTEDWTHIVEFAERICDLMAT